MSKLVQLAQVTADVAVPEGRSVRASMHGWGRRHNSNNWSVEDLRRLRELAATGTPLDAIATMLGRTTSAVRNKAVMWGISLRSPKTSLPSLD